MKQFLILTTTILCFSFSIHAQESKSTPYFGIGGQSFDQVGMAKMSMGLQFQNALSIELAMMAQTKESRNIPIDFKGKDPLESYFIVQAQVGMQYSINAAETIRLVTHAGVHVGKFKGATDFYSQPVSGPTILDALTLFLFYRPDDNYSYTRVNQSIFGVNGDLVLEFDIEDAFSVNFGPNVMYNQRGFDVGISSQVVFKF